MNSEDTATSSRNVENHVFNQSFTENIKEGLEDVGEFLLKGWNSAKEKTSEVIEKVKSSSIAKKTTSGIKQLKNSTFSKKVKEGAITAGNAVKLGAKKTGQIITKAKTKFVKQQSNTDTLIEVTDPMTVC